jgi:hypothetical protein
MPPNEEKPTAEISLDNTRQNGDLSLYLYYFVAIGKWNMVLYVVLTTAFAFFYCFPLVWLS